MFILRIFPFLQASLDIIIKCGPVIMLSHVHGCKQSRNCATGFVPIVTSPLTYSLKTKCLLQHYVPYFSGSPQKLWLNFTILQLEINNPEQPHSLFLGMKIL